MVLLARLGEVEALVAVREATADGVLVGETPDGARVELAVVGGLTPWARRWVRDHVRLTPAHAASAQRLARRSGDAEIIAAVSAAVPTGEP